jgi:quercetin dioxygenase-like cupin family protein
MKAAIVVGIVAILQVQDTRVVPVHEEPRHRLVFDSSTARVLDVQIPPGDTTLFHTHSNPILYVNISSSRMRNQNLDGDWNAPPSAPDGATAGKPAASAPRVVPATPPGRMMSTTSYAERPVTHRVNNIGDSLFRLIGIINPSAGNESNDPSRDFDVTPELDNRWFRGYRRVLATQATSEHRHANPVVLVVASGAATLRMAGAQPRELAAPGVFAFIEANQAHTLAATVADTQIMEVELRRPQ